MIGTPIIIDDTVTVNVSVETEAAGAAQAAAARAQSAASEAESLRSEVSADKLAVASDREAVELARADVEEKAGIAEQAAIDALEALSKVAQGDYRGLATPSTNPGTPSTPVYYFAGESGTYTNFGGLTVTASEGINILSFNGSAWSKAVVPIDLAGYATSEEVEGKLDADELIFEEKKNLFNHENFIVGQFVRSNDGNIGNHAAWGMSEWIPVVAGETYTLSGTRQRHGISFFAKKGDLISIGVAHYIGTTTLPLTFQVPDGAAYVVFNLWSDSSMSFSNIQLEKGDRETDYIPFDLILGKVSGKDILARSVDSYANRVATTWLALHGYESAPKTVREVDERLDSLADLLVEEYVSPNLFDATQIKHNRYIDNNSGHISGISGWGVSDWIPVEAGEIYTLSGERGRNGVSFFAAAANPSLGVGFYLSSAVMPLTFQVPAGANFLVFAIYSAAAPTYGDIQLEKGAVATPFQPFGDLVRVREDLISESNLDTSILEFNETVESGNYLSNSLGNKTLIQRFRPFKESYNVWEVGATHLDGVSVRVTGDDTAPYRIDGSTVGANHNPDFHNKNIERSYFVDGRPIEGVTKRYNVAKNFTVNESYEIEGLSVSGIIARVSYSFVYNRFNSTVIYTDIHGVQAVPMMDIMFVMGMNLIQPYSMYIPKALPFTHESVAYDFAAIHDMSAFSITNRINFTMDRCEPTGILVDRAISLRSDIGFAIGYIPVQDAGVTRRREVATQKAMQISQSGKLYMSAIDSTVLDTLAPGDYYSVVAYKTYFVRHPDRTAEYFIPTKFGTYYFIDWHKTINDRVQLPGELIGAPFEVIEKSDSVVMLSNHNTGTMFFNVTTRGYVVLRFH